MTSKQILVLLVAAIAPATTAAQEPRLLRDLNTSPAAPSSAAGMLAVAGETLFFVHSDGVHGSELWRTDGTAERTAMVLDIHPGPESTRISASLAVGDELYFVIAESPLPARLWRTNGTREGTIVVHTFDPEVGYVSAMFPLAGSVGFITQRWTAENGCVSVLWRSDGRPGGTIPLATLCASHLGTLGARTFMAAPGEERDPARLWVSDGTVGGTAVIQEISPQFKHVWIGPAVVVRDQLVFFVVHTTDDGTVGTIELWRSDGTSEGTMALRVVGGPGNHVRGAAVAGGRLFWLLIVRGEVELWVSGVTAETTALLRRFPLEIDFNRVSFEPPVAAGDRVFFATVPPGSGSELWMSDGTEAGTRVVPSPSGQWDAVVPRIAVGSSLYFTAVDSALGGELWRTDGTPEGTRWLKSIFPETPQWGWWNFMELDGAVLCVAASNFGYEICRSDGTEAGTVRILASVPTTQSSNALLYGGGTALDHLAFLGGGKRWITDGTQEGTRVIDALDFDPQPDFESDFVHFEPDFLQVGRRGFFLRERFGKKGELWVTDGTERGTEFVMSFVQEPQTAQLWNLMAAGDLHFFVKAALDPSPPTELWRSDGTPAGTFGISEHSFCEPVTEFEGDLLFLAASVNGQRNGLWRTDGTVERTAFLSPLAIKPGVVSREFGSPVMQRGVAFFSPWNGIWRTDGTPAGTRFIDENGWNPVALGDTVYFSKDVDRGRAEIWRTDGSVGGTQQISIVRDGEKVHAGSPLLSIEAALVFLERRNNVALRLWRIDESGTAASLADVTPFRGGFMRFITARAVRGSLFLQLDETLFEYPDFPQLLRTDGTPEGTRLVFDLNPTHFHDFIYPLLAATGGKLYFPTDDGVHGVEPWVLQVGPSFEGHFHLEAPRTAPIGATFDVRLYGSANEPFTGFETQIIYDADRLGGLSAVAWDPKTWGQPASTTARELERGVFLLRAQLDPRQAPVAPGLSLPLVTLTFQTVSCTGKARLALSSDRTTLRFWDSQRNPHLADATTDSERWIGIHRGQSFVRGNVDGSPIDLRRPDPEESSVNIADAIHLVLYLYRAGPAPPCLDAADADNDGALNGTDVVVILQHLFAGPAIRIAEPHRSRGLDTGESLGCASPPLDVGCR